MSDYRRRLRGHSRTTMVMVAVVLCSVVTIMPRGFLTLVAKLRCQTRSCYIRRVAHYLDDFLLLLELINSTINFIFYCSMSRKFRETFTSLFTGKRMSPIARGRFSSQYVAHSSQYSRHHSSVYNHGGSGNTDVSSRQLHHNNHQTHV